MKTTLAILLASTALTLGFAIPAWSMMPDELRPQASQRAAEGAFDAGALVRLASDVGDSNDDEGRRMSRGEDDHDDEDSDDDDDDGEDEGSTGAAAGPAPAGAIVPPRNGLFGSGAAPKVKVN